MSMKLNKQAYLGLIRENIDWLTENTGDTLERKHIIAIMEQSIVSEYPEPKSPIKVPYESFNKLRDVVNRIDPHEHYEHQNECLKCEEPLIDVAIRLLEELSPTDNEEKS